MMEKYIQSVSNPSIKEVLKLYNKKDREIQNLFLIEGYKELSLSIKHNIQIQHLFYCLEILQQEGQKLLQEFPSSQKTRVSTKVFDKIAYRGTTEGMLAIARTPHRVLDNIPLENSFVVVLEKMEKPGNIGAVLRTANAAGVSAVVVCDEVSDLYNPNVVRTSLGGLFSTLAVPSTTEKAIAWLKKHQFSILAATPKGAVVYNSIEPQGNFAIVVGSEKDGLSDLWFQYADYRIFIPMVGEVDSLNASVSAAILIYGYAFRKRK